MTNEMTDDQLTADQLQAMAESAQLADDLATGRAELRYEPATPEQEAELLAQLPPPGAPVTVVRPVRLPFEIDRMVKALADARGVSMSDLIRGWISDGLTHAGHAPDPVTELRDSLDAARRALDHLTHPGNA